jgi:hypothetical protein
MSETGLLSRQKILWLASVVEMATGALLILAPEMVVQLLLGTHLSAEGIPLARVAGIALLGLGLACWPPSQGAAGVGAFRGMLVYNTLVSLYLLLIEVRHHVGGLLLWPAVIFHALVALLLIWTWREAARAKPVAT